MNKALKYKAYIKELNKVVDVTGIFNLKDEDFTRVAVDYPSKEDCVIDGKDNHLMQSTGLKDKDGTEIYDGYVISVHQFLFDGNEVEKEHVGIVAYNAETASFFLTKIKGDFYSDYTGFAEGEDEIGVPICFFYGLHEESFKIIGNIYENPALVEDTK